MRFEIYQTGTDTLLKRGSCPDEDVQLQAGPGEYVVAVPAPEVIDDQLELPFGE